MDPRTFSFLLLFSGTALAHDVDGLLQQALSNAAHETIECAAYFQIVSEGMLNSEQQETAEAYQNVSGALIERADLITKEAGMLQATILARYEMAIRDMMAKIDNNFVNMSILVNEYAGACEFLTNNPEKRLEYWTKRMLDPQID